MNSRYAGIAGLGTIALLLANPPLAIAGEEPASKYDPLAYTAIGNLIRANGGIAPRNGAELDFALKSMIKAKDPNKPQFQPRSMVQLPVAFSAVALDSGLTHPRVLLTSSVQTGPVWAQHHGSGGSFGGGGFGGFSGGWGGGGLSAPSVIATAISPGGATDPNLEGRLFLAVNSHVPFGNETQVVKSIEFISWNSQKLRFDFGIIECGESAEVRMLDGLKCFSCHKNRGPILGPKPWSNTIANKKVQDAADSLLRAQVRRRKPPLPFMPPDDDASPDFGQQPIADGPFEGNALTVSHGAEVDGGARRGADLVHDRQMFRFMNRTPDGRKAFVMMLTAIAEPGDLEVVDKDVKLKLNASYRGGFQQFMADWVALEKATPPSMLFDFDPVGSVPPRAGVDPVQYYDSRRAVGEHGLPSERRPSNPRAFVQRPMRPPVLSAIWLAKTIGLTEGDRDFFAEALGAASRLWNRPMKDIAQEVFNGPAFADVLAGGPLPDREDFKVRFYAGVHGDDLIIRGYTKSNTRIDFASGPVPPRNAKDVVEPKLVPSTQCRGCHDIRSYGKAAGTEPIPALLFDPFDKDGREAWLKTADKKTKVQFLTKLLRRLGEDKDMPPTDSAEFEIFRSRDPAAFEAVKMFLEAELRKTKGG